MTSASAFDRGRTVVAIVSQEDARFVDVNAAMREELGWSAEEVIGQRPVDIDLWPDADTRSRIYAALRTRQRVVGLPLLARHKDGRLLPSLLDVECFERHGNIFNFCLLRVGASSGEVQSDPQIEQASYRELYLSATEGLYRSLPDGGFIDVNPAMAEVFGFRSPTAMLALRDMPAKHYYVDATHAAAVHRDLCELGEIRGRRALIRRADGEHRWILENAHEVRDEQGSLRFYEGSVVDITEQVAGEEALRQSEAMYRVLVDHCRDGVFLIQHGIIVFANAALAHMLGYEQGQFIGIEYMRLVADEDTAAQEARRRERESGSMAQQSYEIHLRHRDGHVRLFAVFADAVMLRGKPASTGLVRDITEDRAQRRAIEAAERRYRELFEQSPVGLFRTLEDGSIVDANPAMVRLLGYDDSGQLLAEVRNVAMLYADAKERPLLIDRVLRDGRLVNHETKLLCRDGRQRWVNVNVQLQGDHGDALGAGQVRFAGSVQDIQHRRVIEEALLRSEARYRQLVEHSQSGVFVARGRRYVYVNQRMAAMFGYSERELTTMTFERLLAPDFRDIAMGRLQRFDEGEELPLEFESCYLHKDGHRVYVTVSAGPVDLDGERHLTGTVRDITRQREAEQRLRFHAAHDALTGLPNRMVFHQRLEQRIASAQQQSRHDYAVLFVDLDGFKLVNDGLGHAAGDRLLVSLAVELEAAFRDDALVARYGGDEFTLLSLDSCDSARAEAIAQRLLELFAQPIDLDGSRIYSGASVGIVMGGPHYRTPDQVLRDADTAMYRAKAQGKAAYVFFDADMRAAVQQRLQMETDLRQALEREEFRVHFQPIVDLESGATLGCEALLRWQHPARGLLYPDDFLEVAEESGLLTAIDWWVLRHAAAQVAGWRRDCSKLRLSVNIDERQFNDPQLLSRIEEILAEAGLPADGLQLEITETVFRQGRTHATERLESLAALGLSLVVDDFGTGYSSLESFASATFDALKIDHGFVADITTNSRHQAIARTIVGFAGDLGLHLIAEGVETQAQRELLLAMGCRFAQGYLFGKPMNHEAFSARLTGKSGRAERRA
ncbi:MAG: PAS domain S-box protein [Xanthomonadales bacterium]|nr:PAS domain S-box protein [Xanthomonadales bacterium]